MKLNIATGDMYKFVSHTGNVIKGKCEHDCSYCYMKRYNQSSLRFSESEIYTETGDNKAIFVGSSTDMFAKSIPKEWITKVLDHCNKDDNAYLFQSKNPARFLEFIKHPVFEKSVLCTTIESNRWYEGIMGNCPRIEERIDAMEKISKLGIRTHITIEPIMDFDFEELLEMIKRCDPIQVNIGKNTYRSVKLPEPQKEKVKEFIIELSKFTRVGVKNNLKKKK